MTPLYHFFTRILPSVPACPEPTVEAELIAAAIRFCERTRSWRHVTESALPAGWDAPVLLTAPDGADVFEVERVWFDGRKLDAEPFHKAPQQAEDPAPPYAFSQAEPGSLILWPCGEAGSLRIAAFLKPARNADELPDFLYAHHLDTIASGALAALLMIPEKSWSNPNLATFHLMRFQAACDKHFSANIRGQQRSPRRTRAKFV